MPTYVVWCLFLLALVGNLFLVARRLDDRKKLEDIQGDLQNLRAYNESLTKGYNDMLERALAAEEDNTDLAEQLSAVFTVQADKTVPHREAANADYHYMNEVVNAVIAQARPRVRVQRLEYATVVRYRAFMSLYEGGEQHGTGQRTST